MEEKYKKFLEFNWTNSKEWHSYLDNDIYPRPPLNKIDYFKKKFYRLKIDPDFDINFVPPSNNTNSSSNPGPSGTTYQQQNPYMSAPSGVSQNINSILQKVEFLFWVFFFMSFIIGFSPLKIAAIALVVRSFRRVGVPKFNIEYAQHLFLDEHFQILLYCLLFMIDRLNIFILVPIFITSAMNVSEFFKLNNIRILNKYTDMIYNRRVEIAKLRSNVEVGIGFLLFFGIILGLNSFLLPIFYWQFLRFKYIVNQDTKVTFSKLNNFIDEIKRKPSTPSFIRYIFDKLQQLANYMGRTEAAPGQPAGGANCTIF